MYVSTTGIHMHTKFSALSYVPGITHIRSGMYIPSYLQAPLQCLSMIMGAQLFSRRACTYARIESRSLFLSRGLRSKIPQLGIIVSEAAHGAFSLDKLCYPDG